ncbi:MAG: hypothetical protein HRT57_13545 [Crocinitomicaceae bacterium]|nr:hypothetical protein [Crocinitomicaceae bacterium]
MFSILVLFVGSIGVSIVSHFCQGNETTVLTFTEKEHCGDKEGLQTDDCCTETEEEEEDDCCNDELRHVQLKLDFFDEVDISAVIIPEFTAELFLIYEEIPRDLSKEEVHNNSPPPKSGRDLILKKQNWLI